MGPPAPRGGEPGRRPPPHRPSEEAVRLGLVHRVLPPERLLPETLAVAQRLARECAPTSLRVIKEQLYADLRGTLAASEAAGQGLLEEMVTSPEFREGVAALLERRPPDYGGFPAKAGSG